MTASSRPGPAWPAPPDARDPWRGPPAALEGSRAALAHLLDEVEAGAAPRSALEAPARALGLWGPARRDARTPVHTVDAVPSDAQLARIAADLCPAAGMEASDRVLGPWADERLPARVRQVALAVLCFAPPDGDRLSPAHQWSRRQPLPSVEERARVRAVGLAPLSAWQATQQADGRWLVTDPLDLDPRHRPGSPVLVRDPAELGVGTTATLFARIAHTEDGPVASAPLLVRPSVPDALLRAWADLLVLRVRLSDPGRTFEAVLRGRGCDLARRGAEWAWWHA